MKPELKAKEIVSKIMDAIWVSSNPNHIKRISKDCALVMVNEIIEVVESKKEYWLQVKQEIGKL